MGITLDETTTRDDIATLWSLFAQGQAVPDFAPFERGVKPLIPLSMSRSSQFLTDTTGSNQHIRPAIHNTQHIIGSFRFHKTETALAGDGEPGIPDQARKAGNQPADGEARPQPDGQHRPGAHRRRRSLPEQ